ncbi:MAG: hypothetical protein JWP86_1581 [Phenylobacterium sp.]|nr:hypothetical protein [Phenylobacterium sp.]MDB5494244.1 hypothetical protein [Phenylobacterium sp.]
MTRHPPIISAPQALRVVLAGGLLLMLGANLPGHLSYDSVAQLYEGHFHVRETWGPAIYAWLLGVFDAIIPGTALYVAASGLLFFASLAGLAAVRGRVSWLGVVFAALMALTPQVLIYQGIVWKDIAFANTAIGASVCLARAFARWEMRPSRWLWLAGAVVLFSVASMVRQNGILVPIVAALALGWVASRGNWRRGALWAGGGLLALTALIQLLTVVAVPAFGAPEGALKEGVRIVQNYDLLGAVSLDRTYRLSDIEAVNPREVEIIRTRGPINWSPDRIDWIDRDPVVGSALNAIPNDVARRQWLDLILRRPDLYLRMRWMDFSWLFLSPNADRCLPIYTGVDAPASKMAPLGIAHRYSRADQQLTNYDTWYIGTPVQLHWAYALAALVVAGLLLWRRQPADLAIAALMLGVLAVTGSFFVITIACDYRYLYILDLAALVGIYYLLLDPTGFRRPLKVTRDGA